MTTEYVFDPKEAFNEIEKQTKAFAERIHAKKFVLGISGGKDSTVCAYILAKIFGKENVYGVMMPNGVQKDITDSLEVIKLTGINSYAVNINKMVEAVDD